MNPILTMCVRCHELVGMTCCGQECKPISVGAITGVFYCEVCRSYHNCVGKETIDGLHDKCEAKAA